MYQITKLHTTSFLTVFNSIFPVSGISIGIVIILVALGVYICRKIITPKTGLPIEDWSKLPFATESSSPWPGYMTRIGVDFVALADKYVCDLPYVEAVEPSAEDEYSDFCREIRTFVADIIDSLETDSITKNATSKELEISFFESQPESWMQELCSSN